STLRSLPEGARAFELGRRHSWPGAPGKRHQPLEKSAADGVGVVAGEARRCSSRDDCGALLNVLCPGARPSARRFFVTAARQTVNYLTADSPYLVHPFTRKPSHQPPPPTMNTTAHPLQPVTEDTFESEVIAASHNRTV